MTAIVHLTGEPATPDDVVAVAREGARIVVAPEVVRRLAAARAVVEDYARREVPAYGITTGLGAGVDTRLAADDLAAFQGRVPLARSVGVGAALPREVVRATMAARVASMAVGGSGAQQTVLDGLVAALAAGFHPVVPATGSIGAADLAPLAHIASGLVGHGLAEWQGTVLPAGEALARAGLAPLRLGPKDGLALVSANALSTGQACLVLADARRLLGWSLAAIALNFEAFRASATVLDPRCVAARPAFGQIRAAASLRALLAGSPLLAEGAARRLQDPLGYRCAPQIWGALIHARDEAEKATRIELASAGDNPLVLAEAGLILSHGNFDMTAFALSFERLGQALAHCAGATAHRTMKIMSPGLSDLPRFLSPRGTTRTGFATVQKTVSALEAEIRHRALPISLAAIPVADGIEDHATMAPAVVAKTAEIVDRLRLLVATELVAAAQAVELRGVAGSLGEGVAIAYAAVRAVAAPLDEDRPLGPDLDRVAALIAAAPPPDAALAQVDRLA